jgi:hypothetical protein
MVAVRTAFGTRAQFRRRQFGEYRRPHRGNHSPAVRAVLAWDRVCRTKHRRLQGATPAVCSHGRGRSGDANRAAIGPNCHLAPLRPCETSRERNQIWAFGVTCREVHHEGRSSEASQCGGCIARYPAAGLALRGRRRFHRACGFCTGH